ncbi:MAG: hypothetical protein ACREUA_05570 [Burkholderiales bacterium]
MLATTALTTLAYVAWGTTGAIGFLLVAPLLAIFVPLAENRDPTEGLARQSQLLALNALFESARAGQPARHYVADLQRVQRYTAALAVPGARNPRPAHLLIEAGAILRQARCGAFAGALTATPRGDGGV